MGESAAAPPRPAVRRRQANSLVPWAVCISCEPWLLVSDLVRVEIGGKSDRGSPHFDAFYFGINHMK